MKFHVLGTGSKGNCAIIETQTSAILIDCGLTKTAMLERMAQVGFDASKVAAMLVTHEHTDHTKGLGVCLRGLKCENELPIYATAGTRANCKYLSEYENNLRICAGEVLNIAGVQVEVFNTSHDVAEPVGFRFTCNDGFGESQTIGYMTDSGICTPMGTEMLQGCDLLAIETNHDPKMLKNGPYPYAIKQRIASDRGHMSNIQTSELLPQLVSDNLRTVVGMHISQENNYVDLPKNLLEQQLHALGLDANVTISGQNIPRSF